VDYLFDRIGNILKRIRTAEGIFFLLDYDGTLTPIVSHPGEAILSKKTRALLLAFKKNPRFLLAIVSGRSLKDIRTLVGLKGIYYVGNHGLEISASKSRVRQLIPDKIVTELGGIRDRLNSQLKNVDGVLIEDKECILTIHYRNVDAGWVPSILMMLKQEVRESITPLCLGFGKMVFEIRPKSNVHKGTAVLELLEEVKKDKFLPLYMGDDKTDEDAFRVLNRRGITIFVGFSGNSSAQYYVNDPFEVYQFLKMVKEEFRLL
jgi:trehalose 6-phosphate phosphatase